MTSKEKFTAFLVRTRARFFKSRGKAKNAMVGVYNKMRHI